MDKLILVRGIPGAGKTTFAKALAKKFPNAELVAADDYFITNDGEYLFDARKLRQAHDYCQRKTQQLLDKGKVVIVHNTFTTVKEFEPYLRMADKPTVSLFVYNIFDGGMSDGELYARNTHGVPLSAIQRMRARYAEAPVEEMHVHITGTNAYWLFPEADHVELEVE